MAGHQLVVPSVPSLCARVDAYAVSLDYFYGPHGLRDRQGLIGAARVLGVTVVDGDQWPEGQGIFVSPASGLLLGRAFCVGSGQVAIAVASVYTPRGRV